MPVNDDEFSVSFVCAKTRVASLIKPLSIPRLELQAASLLAELFIKVESILSKAKSSSMHSLIQQLYCVCWTNHLNNGKNLSLTKSAKSKKLCLQQIGATSAHKRIRADYATCNVTVAKMLTNKLWIEGS